MHLKIWKKRNISINFKDQIDLDKFLEKFNGLLNIKNLKNNLDKWKEIADKRNILEKLKPYQKKENDNLLKEYFVRWKNVTDKNKLLRNKKSQKKLANTIGNVDESKKKNDLKKYFDKWKDNAIKSYPKSKIFPRGNPKKYKNKSINKKNKEQKLLKDAFNKWKQNSTFLPSRNVLQQIWW